MAMNYHLLTAPCGLDCFNCPMYHAQNDEDLRLKIAGQLGLPPDLAQCPGCRTSRGTIGFLGMTEPCNVFRCTAEKRLESCADCPDFPCDYLHPYADKASQVPHNTKVFNLCLIKKMGLEAWATQKAGLVKKTYFSAKFNL